MKAMALALSQFNTINTDCDLYCWSWSMSLNGKRKSRPPGSLFFFPLKHNSALPRWNFWHVCERREQVFFAKKPLPSTSKEWMHKFFRPLTLFYASCRSLKGSHPQVVRTFVTNMEVFHVTWLEAFIQRPALSENYTHNLNMKNLGLVGWDLDNSRWSFIDAESHKGGEIWLYLLATRLSTTPRRRLREPWTSERLSDLDQGALKSP